MLIWVSHAERPLWIDEICNSLAVGMEATDHALENIRPQDTVLGSCLGPVVVDNATSTVRLIHYTLQEYLSWPGILPDAHKTLAQSCLAYLNYDQLKRHLLKYSRRFHILNTTTPDVWTRRVWDV